MFRKCLCVYVAGLHLFELRVAGRVGDVLRYVSKCLSTIASSCTLNLGAHDCYILSCISTIIILNSVHGS